MRIGRVGIVLIAAAVCAAAFSACAKPKDEEYAPGAIQISRVILL